MQTLRPTHRIPRWRGQILDFLSRLWIGLRERDESMGETRGELIGSDCTECHLTIQI
jgi:hypothetical protein